MLEKIVHLILPSHPLGCYNAVTLGFAFSTKERISVYNAFLSEKAC